MKYKSILFSPWLLRIPLKRPLRGQVGLERHKQFLGLHAVT